MTPRERANYIETVRKTANMVRDSYARRLVSKTGLQLMNLTWEDTGRFKNSAVGPNISDMTIQVTVQDGRQIRTELMPVIRFPNFSDRTGDIDPSAFTLLVGNEDGKPLKRVSLYDFLDDPSRYLHDPKSWDGRARDKTLLALRDSKVLVSAQACFLPVPKSGIATFNPVLFNYQSYEGNPAVLTILATREGTSVTIIDNKRDAVHGQWMWGQRLFHNSDGERASLTGQRLTDFIKDGRPTDNPGGVEASDEALNMVLLIQVPLKQKRPMRFGGGTTGGGGFGGGGAADAVAEDSKALRGLRSDVEAAVIGHGELEGPFTEIDGLKIERDPRFPIRVTVQFYLATSNGVISQQNVAKIKRDIDRVYDATENVGSLVTGGHTGRVTEYYGIKVQPRYWWNAFWNRYERNTGYSRYDAIRRLRQQLGSNYMQRPVCDLYLRDILRK
ncbi:MAG: hypothetical protein IH944_02250 [Armatimonadetes bacterium]|nr:hypothetical protein [Armatimonadota bacterium]